MLPAPENDGVDGEPVLVDEVVVHQGVDEVRAAGDQDVPAGLLFEIGDLFGDIATEERRVRPLHLLQALGDHVFRQRIHPVREPIISGRRRPEGRPDLIGDAPQEERVYPEDLVDLEALDVLGGVSQRPAVLPVGMLFVPRRFHDAVERHELGCDQPSDRSLLSERIQRKV